jgi:hypothetical protein
VRLGPAVAGGQGARQVAEAVVGAFDLPLGPTTPPVAVDQVRSDIPVASADEVKGVLHDTPGTS